MVLKFEISQAVVVEFWSFIVEVQLKDQKCWVHNQFEK